MCFIYEMKEVSLKPHAQQRLDKCEKEKLCVACMKPLIPGKRVLRGCCESCYRATTRAIDRGITTEEKRLAEGRFRPKNITGRPFSNPVSLELSKCSKSPSNAQSKFSKSSHWS